MQEQSGSFKWPQSDSQGFGSQSIENVLPLRRFQSPCQTKPIYKFMLMYKHGFFHTVRCDKTVRGLTCMDFKKTPTQIVETLWKRIKLLGFLFKNETSPFCRLVN